MVRGAARCDPAVAWANRSSAVFALVIGADASAPGDHPAGYVVNVAEAGRFEVQSHQLAGLTALADEVDGGVGRNRRQPAGLDVGKVQMGGAGKSVLFEPTFGPGVEARRATAPGGFELLYVGFSHVYQFSPGGD